MAQTVGYLVAAAGPLVVGILREASGGWTVPLVFLLAMLVPRWPRASARPAHGR